jgi:transposase-like protein
MGAGAERIREWLVANGDRRLLEFIDALGVEQGAVAYLEEARWPNGVRCLRCSSERIGFLTVRQKHYCRSCRYQFRVTVGTVMHDSHVPAATWLAVVGLMVYSRSGLSANQLNMVLGGSYKTAWFVEHRIRVAMAEALANGARDSRPADRRLPIEAAGRRYRSPGRIHAGKYTAEANWRLAYGADETGFRRTVEALMSKRPLPYRELLAAPGSARRHVVS